MKPKTTSLSQSHILTFFTDNGGKFEILLDGVRDYFLLRQVEFENKIDNLSNDMVVHIQRNSRNYQRSGMGEQVSKWNNKMLALLCIATSLCPSVRIDEQVTSLMHYSF